MIEAVLSTHGPFSEPLSEPASALMRTLKMTLDRVRVLLSAQNALLGEITPEIRAIDITWSSEEIRLQFIVDGQGKSEMIETTNVIEAEIQGSFCPLPHISSIVLCLPAGTPIPVIDKLSGGHARIFSRREED